MADIAYKIIENVLTLPEKGKFHKELNLVSWNDRDPVYDLRGWNKDRSEMTKGITLSKEEIIELKGGLQKWELQ